MVARGYAWQAGAAYLYVLLLDGASLAWEYLRRNPDYRRDWYTAAVDPVSAAGPHAARQWQVVRGLRSLLEAGARGTEPMTQRRPSRIAVAHMRSLQALDGILAGASHREIARAIFGVRRIAQAWQPDSELR